MSDRRFKWATWLLPIVLGLLAIGTTACDLPQVSAEERLFMNLSLDFLSEYQLPKQTFQQTPVGGLSAITYDSKRDRLYAQSDDRSELAPARFYTLKLELDARDRKQPRIQKVTVEAVTTLKDENGQPFAKGTIDPEGIALSPLGSVFVSSEGVTHDRVPPFVREFDLKTGQPRRSLPIPPRYIPDAADPPTRGIRDNLGFESLTLSPNSTAIEPYRLFTATESALAQDFDPESKLIPNRFLHYMVEADRSLFISEHLYLMEPAPNGAMYQGLTELLAIDQGGHFLSLERSFGLSTGFNVKLFQLSTGGATDTSAIGSLKQSNVQPIQKQLLLDLKQLGIRLDNLEGMTIGPRLPDGSQSLLLVSDNNFREDQVTQFLLFRLKTPR